MTTRIAATALAFMLAATATTTSAHSGPPFPIVTGQTVGPYVVSVWTDPDTTDDGSPGGQFWIRLHGTTSSRVPEQTRATVTTKPLDRTGPERSASASPVRGDLSNQFAAVFMDHEGRFAVHVTIQGPLGQAAVDATVEASYDLRPSRSLLLFYLAPFIAVGLLWGRLLIRRRRASRSTPPPSGGDSRRSR